METILTVLLGSVQLSLAVLGARMALKPPLEKNHNKIISAFLVLGLLGIGITGYQQYLNSTTADKRDVILGTILSNTSSTVVHLKVNSKNLPPKEPPIASKSLSNKTQYGKDFNVYQEERIQKENEARRKIRLALAQFKAEGLAILSHCEGFNIKDGSPVSPGIDPWSEFAEWNIRVRDYLMNEKKLGYIYQENKEDVVGMEIPITAAVRNYKGGKNINTYLQLKARMMKLDGFAKEFPDVY